VTFPVLTIIAALLGPMSYLPGLWRMIVGRTADGVSPTLCGIGLLSYGTWVGLAAGVSYGFYSVLLTSTCLAMVQAALAVRYAPGSVPRMLLWLLAGAGSGLVALRWPWLAVVYIVPLDLIWYGRSIRDVLRSVAAKAVSVWGWAMSTSANFAWVLEARAAENTPLMVQCALLTCASIAGIVATETVRLRVRRNPPDGWNATPEGDAG